MIKQTFYNLPKEKRERIIWAIRLEFSRSPAERISINRIVQEANISRGSFYQYFDDKVDLIQIITEDFTYFMKQATKKSLEKSNGDIFSVPFYLFDAIMSFAEKDDNKRIIERIISNFKMNSDLITDYLKNRHIVPCKSDVFPLINRDMLKITDDNDLQSLFDTLMTILFKAIFDVFACGKDTAYVKDNLNRTVNLLKYGTVSAQKQNKESDSLD